MLEFLINDFWHMIFCKFDQSISIFPYEKAAGHRLIVASALKELTNMAAMLDFVLISTFYFKNWWWKYILDSMALKNKFQQHDDYGMYVIFWGGGDASHNGRHLGFVEIRKGMICVEAPKYFFLTAEVRNCGIFLFLGEKWRYMVLHNIELPVCGIYVDKFNIIKYWWSK